MRKIVVGIDEVGRGPIAGPIVVGAVCLLRPITWEEVPGLKDSKKLSEKKREEWYAWVLTQKHIRWEVAGISANRIDRIGIAVAGNEAARKVLSALKVKQQTTRVLLDYGLKVEEDWDQTAIVKGDEKEVAIALASIMAKVTRDRYMVHITKKFPGYAFELHKGYGTRKHYAAIKKQGLCTLHRKCFLKRLH